MILHIDDNPADCWLVRKLLSGHRIHTVTVYGSELDALPCRTLDEGGLSDLVPMALDWLARHRPDLTLIDYKLGLDHGTVIQPVLEAMARPYAYLTEHTMEESLRVVPTLPKALLQDQRAFRAAVEGLLGGRPV